MYDRRELISVTVGIPCYNEEGNIGRLLERVCDTTYRVADIKEIIVVSSGCTDGTVRIVEDFIKTRLDVGWIKHIIQDKRYGKANAINEIIRMAKGDVVFIVGGDVLPDSKAFDLVARHFIEPSVGAVGTRNVPLTQTGGFMDFVDNQLWYVHHQVCTKYPKLGGDFIAFRRAVGVVDTLSAVDDLAVEMKVISAGYKVVYEAEACNFIKAPKSVRDFVKQRRRIYAGYLSVGNKPKTMSFGTGMTVLKHCVWEFGFIVLEVWARLMGWIDYKKGKRHVVWERIDVRT